MKTCSTPTLISCMTVLLISMCPLGAAAKEESSLDRAKSSGVEGNGDSYFSAISSNGRLVIFYSFASNLVPADGNGVSDVFVHDRQTGETTRVSVGSDGGQEGVGDQGRAVGVGWRALDRWRRGLLRDDGRMAEGGGCEDRRCAVEVQDTVRHHRQPDDVRGS